MRPNIFGANFLKFHYQKLQTYLGPLQFSRYRLLNTFSVTFQAHTLVYVHHTHTQQLPQQFLSLMYVRYMFLHVCAMLCYHKPCSMYGTAHRHALVTGLLASS
jgi:hypothetical protein